MVQISRTHGISVALQLSRAAYIYGGGGGGGDKLQPKIHGMFDSLPASESIESRLTFSVQSNRTRGHLEANRDHLDQTPRSHLDMWIRPTGKRTTEFDLNGCLLTVYFCSEWSNKKDSSENAKRLWLTQTLKGFLRRPSKSCSKACITQSRMGFCHFSV